MLIKLSKCGKWAKNGADVEWKLIHIKSATYWIAKGIIIGIHELVNEEVAYVGNGKSSDKYFHCLNLLLHWTFSKKEISADNSAYNKNEIYYV